MFDGMPYLMTMLKKYIAKTLRDRDTTLAHTKTIITDKRIMYTINWNLRNL